MEKRKFKKLDKDLQSLISLKTEGEIEDFEAEIGCSLYEAIFTNKNTGELRKKLCSFFGLSDELRRAKPAFQISLFLYEAHSVQAGITEDEETKN